MSTPDPISFRVDQQYIDVPRQDAARIADELRRLYETAGELDTDEVAVAVLIEEALTGNAESVDLEHSEVEALELTLRNLLADDDRGPLTALLRALRDDLDLPPGHLSP